MSEPKILLAAGGDERFAGLAGLLAADPRYTVYAIGLGGAPAPGVRCLEELSELRQQPDILVLPLPLSADGVHLKAPFYQKSPILLRYLLNLGYRGSRVYCGKAGGDFKRECAARGLVLTDYLDDEAFTVKNAAATAEAALVLAASLRRRALFDSKVLVLGGGRIAKRLCAILAACGAAITCAARAPEQRAWAMLSGAEAVPLSAIPNPSRFDLVFSTIPQPVFGESELSRLSPGCLLIELGSDPGGIDEKAAAALGLSLQKAPSLPGRMMPESAAQWLWELILQKEAELL